MKTQSPGEVKAPAFPAGARLEGGARVCYVQDAMRLAGKVALVTGGAVRVGRAISLALAREGAHVVVHHHRSGREARALALDIRRLGVEALPLRADLARPAEVAAMVRAAFRAFPAIDVLVNNAAIFPRTPLLEITPTVWDRVLAVNLRGPFLCAQAVARRMLRAGTGKIINIADVGGARAWPAYIPYCVSKAGLIMLTQGLAVALAPHVQVNAVAPGPVLFPEEYPDRLRRKVRATIPMRREGAPEDVAAAVVFFATSPAYITGQTLFVDGGLSAR